MLWATQYNTIDATAANGLELQVIAAVVVGGVAIFGGSGSVVGAALGALLLQTINSALNVLGVASPLWTQAISGFLLLVAITLDRAIQAPALGRAPGRRDLAGRDDDQDHREVRTPDPEAGPARVRRGTDAHAGADRQPGALGPADRPGRLAAPVRLDHPLTRCAGAAPR